MQTDAGLTLFDSPCSKLRDQLLEVEEELASLSERHGRNIAVQDGPGLTRFNLLGDLRDKPQVLLDGLGSVQQSLQNLIKEAGLAARSVPKPSRS